MSTLLSISKMIGGPGSIGFLVLCCAVALVLSRFGRRGRQLARVSLFVVFTAYLVAGLPVMANTIERRLPVPPSPASLSHFTGTDLLVVLSGDNARGRAREARRIIEAAHPRCVLVSGGSWFVNVMVDEGVGTDRFTVDDTAATTREQIQTLPRWIADCQGAILTVVIASRLQMPRVAALTRAAGLAVVLAPSPVDDEPANSGLRRFVPSYLALRITRDALYEHVALMYYRRNGWID